MSKLRDKIISSPKIDDIEVLITLLAKLLDNNWEEDHTSINQEYLLNTGLDPLYILANFLHKANSIDSNDFIFGTQLDIKEPKTYK